MRKRSPERTLRIRALGIGITVVVCRIALVNVLAERIVDGEISWRNKKQ